MLESRPAACPWDGKGEESMNKRELSQMRYKRVRILPVARRIDPNGIDLAQIDDVWLITQASREELELRNTRTDHIVQLGTDHVREYMTDTGRTDGIFKLKSQVFLFARGLAVEPLA
jgi:hypothetical protein